MTCCGKAKNIVHGFATLGRDAVVGENKYEFTDDRIRECQECDSGTWLTWKEYAKFVIGKLPKRENAKGRKLFCMECKCFAPAAARSPSKKCKLDKWES